MKKNSVRY